MQRPKRRVVFVLAAVLAATVVLCALGAQSARAASPTALILGDTVTVPGPAPAAATESLEQYEAEQDGYTVTSVTGAQWDAMTAAQFAKYQVLIIGDPTCGPADGVGDFQAAVANESTWEPVVMGSGGNKVIIGTDPTYHYTVGSGPTANVLEKNGISFAGAVAGATGAYVDLSCTYTFSSPGTAVPLLDGLSTHGPGSFTVGGAPCAGSIAIVSASGPTAGLHDSDLSNWSCSVHEFFNQFPSDYTPLALATDPSVPVTYTGTDVDTGQTVSGSPYILVSGGGVTVTSNLTLTPPTQSLSAGGTATVTANLVSGSSPVSGASIAFDISSGPNAGKTGTGTTNGSGNTSFTYPDTGGTGTDQILATYTSPGGVTSQGTASVTWTPATAAACAMSSTTNSTAFSSSGQSIHIENGVNSIITSPQHLVLRSLSGTPSQYFALGGPGSFTAMLTAAKCSDNTAHPLGSGDQYNTITGTGTGVYGTDFAHNSPGYTIQFEIGDYGEGSTPPHTALDSVIFTIKNSGGTVVWTGRGTLTSGSETETG